MGHCISAVILKDDFDPKIAESYDLVGIKLDFSLTMFPVSHYYTAYWGKLTGILGQLPGQQPTNLIFPCDRVIAYFMTQIAHSEQPMYTIIATDYFGGIGEQWALVYQGDSLAANNINTINSALQFLGVKAQEGMDEFDTVGLDNYRAMPDALDKYIDLAEQIGV